MKVQKDIIERVEREFGDSAPAALDRLGKLARTVEGANARVLRCVLYLAGSSLEALHHHADCAATDWRDVIL